MTDPLGRIGALVAERFGLLPPKRGDGGALAPVVDERRRARGLTRDQYASRIVGDVDEQWALASALSNGWTWFFRDREQLMAFVGRLGGVARTEPAMIWVAGCSTGEEAYGLAMLCAESGLDARIVASDLSRARLDAAARGVYDEHTLRAVTRDERSRWLEPLGPGSFRVREELRSAVELRLHNLMDPPPALRRFDAVVCRNVLIHATEAAALQMVRGLTQALVPGGELVLGASDLMQIPIARPPSGAPPPPAEPSPRAASIASTELVDAAALVTVGNLCVEAHAFDRAEAAYRRAETLDPCSAELHVAWGVLHRKRGDLERAMAALRRAVFLDETSWPAWALLAGVLARLGSHTQSALAAEQARSARRERPALEWRSHTGRLLLDQLGAELDGQQRSGAPVRRAAIDESASATVRGGE